MDTAVAVLADLRSLGLELIAKDGKLQWRPEFLVNGPMRQRMIATKHELIGLINGGHLTGQCPLCGWALDAKKRCVKCFDRLCETCGRITGSYFFMNCFSCVHDRD
jgi:hypothetical protein